MIMRRYMVVFVVLAAASTITLGLSNYWQIRQDLRAIFPEHEVKITLTRTDSLPASVDHLGCIPPGTDIHYSAGNCCQHALYYYKTAQEASEHGWSPVDTNNQFSANFIAAHTNDGVIGGAPLAEGIMFQFMCDWGDTKVPLGLTLSEAAYDTAINYRCQNWYWIDPTTDQGITALKRQLAGGDNVWIGFDPEACLLNPNDSTFTLGDTMAICLYGYAGCAFGYDDNHPTSDGPGAFHVVDSHQLHRYWVSYAVLKHPRSSWGVAYYATDRIDYRPIVKMRAKLVHPKRGEVMIRVGIGPTAAPRWVKTMTYNSLYGPSYVNGDVPFPNNNIVMDLTDGLPWLDSASVNNVFLECWDNRSDGISGKVEYLSVEHLGWGVRSVFPCAPQIIPDYHIPTFTSVSLRRQYISADARPVQNQLAQGDSVVDTVSVTPINGYNLPLTFHDAIQPVPASGSLQVQFNPATIVPPGTSLMTIHASLDLSIGWYTITITGGDGVDTAAFVTSTRVCVTGSGQALGVGTSASMMQLLRQVWPQTDSLAAVPLVIGSNYHTVVLESGGTPADTAVVRSYIGQGGNVLLCGRAPADLAGDNALSGIAGWLGAQQHVIYTSSGLKIISTYANPFGVFTINVGDTLGTANTGYSRLMNINSGAVLLGRYGTANTAIAVLYNEFGTGHSLWVTGGAGFSAKHDSLIRGYFQRPSISRASVNDIHSVAMPCIGKFAMFPNPVKGNGIIQLGIERQCQLVIGVYDVCGRRIRGLYAGRSDPGTTSIHWNGRDDHGRALSSGIYFVQAVADGKRFHKKIILCH
jgi:hypothetical protein